MVKIISNGVLIYKGNLIIEDAENINIESFGNQLVKAGEPVPGSVNLDKGHTRKNTIAYGILSKHNTSGDLKNLKIRFDALASHDITYVGIVQTARASGMKEFPIPYVLTNCHNSLCAVGGTINEDDHVFGLSAAQKYGGIYVPAHQAVIHQYMREMMSGCGKMLLGSDSHTRYGALGTMGVGEGGPELVKQLLETYDISYPEVVAIYLDGKPQHGVGPQDVALAIIGAVFKNGFVKNKVLEFIGPGIGNLSVDYRNGIDVMTTETTCLSSIWCTDEKVAQYYSIHGRPDEYSELQPGDIAYYDGLVHVDLSKVQPMIAMPFHPSNVYTIADVNNNLKDILKTVEEDAKNQLDDPKGFSLTEKIVDGKLKVDQGIVAGCSGGTFENICEVASILENGGTGNGYFSLSVYPASQPIYIELIKNGAAAKLLTAGAVMKTAFCGPCFGAGDVPSNNGFSIRHSTRNFPSREGSKPGNGQIASVALMDARSIAATALNGGYLTPGNEVNIPASSEAYTFDKQVYKNRIYEGYKNPQTDVELKFGPSITDWPKMSALTENMLLKVVTVINDPVTTTDELIPSGETSSYRSNPLKLAEFTLSRKDPGYVGKAKAVQQMEVKRSKLLEAGSVEEIPDVELSGVFAQVLDGAESCSCGMGDLVKATGIGSVIFAMKPGDGSAREQAASCQKVLGGWANIAVEYATKRYRSNLINWGMLPFTIDNAQETAFNVNDYIFIPGIRKAVESGEDSVQAIVIGPEGKRTIKLKLASISKDERDIILAGCLINYYALQK